MLDEKLERECKKLILKHLSEFVKKEEVSNSISQVNEFFNGKIERMKKELIEITKSIE
jgi:hypothetical protein